MQIYTMNLDIDYSICLKWSDIYEKDNKYHIEMDIPGFDKKDIKIESDKG